MEDPNSYDITIAAWMLSAVGSADKSLECAD